MISAKHNLLPGPSGFLPWIVPPAHGAEVPWARLILADRHKRGVAMRTLFSQLSTVLPRRAKRNLVLATVGSVGIGLLDGFGLLLILPLVNLATGQAASSSFVSSVSGFFGDPGTATLTLILAVAVVVLFVLKDLGALWFAWWLAGFVATERVRTSARLLHHMLSAPYSQVASRSSAEMMRTMDTSVLQVFSLTINGLMLTASTSISVLAVLAALVALAPVPTVVLIAYFGVASLAFDRLAKPRALAAGVETNRASLTGFRSAFAALGAIKELKLRGTQEHFVDSYREAQLRGAYAGRVASFIATLPKYLLEIMFIVAVGIVLVLSSRTGGGSGVGLIALFVAAGFRLLPAVTSLLASASGIRVGADSLRIVHAEVTAAGAAAHEATAADTRGDGADWITSFERQVALEGVDFRYPGTEVDVLKNIWIEVPRGSSLALVGGSGAGKTTLVDILVGLLTPTRGRVSVDGTDIQLHPRGWQRSVAYVAQDIFLLEATLAENVAFDQPGAEIDRERVLAALGQAQLLEIVEALPDGIDTQVGERGARLSGGQRQRIGIARALYRQCQVLVLDEATAALDNETEHRVNTTIAELHGSITVVVIAHRLSTVRHTDQVVFLDRGRVAATGTFDEVRRTNKDFARLVELGSLGPATASAASDE